MKYSPFLYAYRAFIGAMGDQDMKQLEKMCERKLLLQIRQNFKDIDRHNYRFFSVAENIKLKMKLLDLRLVRGVYINRAKNFSEQYYEEDTEQ